MHMKSTVPTFAPLVLGGALALITTSPTALATSATPTTLPAAQGMQEGGPAASIGQLREDAVELVTISWGDLREWVKHPKDAGLARAFSLLDERLAELPNELGNEMPSELAPAFSPEAIPTWLRFLRSPKSVTLGLSGEQAMQAGNPLVFGFGLDSDSADSAAAYKAEIVDLLRTMGAPIGPDMIQQREETLIFRMGMNPQPLGTTRAAEMVQGGPIVEELRLNVAGAIGFARQMMAAQGAPPEAAMVFDVLQRMGLDQMAVEVAVRTDGDTMRTASIATGIGAKMREAGIIPADGLTTAHLLPIPADATLAYVERLDLLAMFDALNGLVSEIMAEQGQEGFDIAGLAGSMGIDLRDGLFGALGSTYGVYASDATGGGGALSTVMFIAVEDAEALVETREQLLSTIEPMIAGETRGYVAARSWMQGEVEYTTMMFPGLPIPFEPTVAMSSEWLVVGMTPQAALGAMGHIGGGGPSLASNEMVSTELGGEAKTSISFMDTAYYARQGFGPASLMMSAISNAVRSPIDGAREPGPIMPVYSDFAQGIEPTVGSSRLVGDDLVTNSTTDGSIVVQTAMLVGLVHEYMAAIALPLVAVGIAETEGNFDF